MASHNILGTTGESQAACFLRITGILFFIETGGLDIKNWILLLQLTTH